jgi:AcrR family transcriptional regulator
MTARSSPSTEPLRADARRNRQRLLDVAHEAFLETGVTASMDDIARRAGVGSGTLYRHFPTRDALILALVADDLERLAALADELRTRDPSNGLESWFAELVEHNRTYRGLAESIIASTGKPTPLGAACDRLHSAGTALVRDAQGRGTVRTDITPRDAIDLAAAIAWTTQDDSDDRRCRLLLQVAMDGLHGPPT